MTIVLDDEITWPADILDYLSQHQGLFQAWELHKRGSNAPPVISSEYDSAVYGLRAILGNHSLHGYHCTRLTEPEISNIKANGMLLPSGELLRKRIQKLKKMGLVTPAIAKRFFEKNQADDSNRAGMIWFCFYSPHTAGQSGIERFFRSWGGEALYNSHEDDPETGAALKRIGTPCIVECEVPISSLAPYKFPNEVIARRFLVNRGFKTVESIYHDGYVIHPISMRHIKRILQHPCMEFVSLTGCGDWSPPLV